MTADAGDVAFAGAAVLAAVALAWTSFRLRVLDASGAVGLAVLSAVVMIFTGGNPSWWGVILAFFVSASGLTKLAARSRRPAIDDDARRGRSLAQVLANGSPPTLCILGAWLWGGQGWYLPFLGSVAAVNADTWATEIGTRWGGNPRNIVSWRPMESGQSGGVTVAGTVAAWTGALFVGCTAIVLGGPLRPLDVAIVAVAGTAGSLADSVLGSTLQPAYTCARCEAWTENAAHCGTAARLRGGLPFFTTHWVNFTCGCSGALVSGLLLAL